MGGRGVHTSTDKKSWRVQSGNDSARSAPPAPSVFSASSAVVALSALCASLYLMVVYSVSVRGFQKADGKL